MCNLQSKIVIITTVLLVGSVSQAFAQNTPTYSWFWNGGNKTENKPGLYPPSSGQTGVPGARYQSMYCTDPSGNFWLFGGYGYDQNEIKGYLGDLWSFDPVTGDWTWVSGSQNANSAGTYPSHAESAGVPGARASGALFCDGNGDIWLFGGLSVNGELSDFWQYSSLSGGWKLKGGNNQASVADTDSGLYQDGYPGARSQPAYWTYGSMFFMFGGKTSEGYMNDFWTYQVGSIINSWEFLGGPNDMNDAGLYPSTYGEQGMPASRGSAATWIDKNGILWLYGGWAADNQFYDDLWSYNPVYGVWTFVGGMADENDSPSYPDVLGVAGGSPGSRAGASAWFVAGQPAYIFGGRDNKVYNDLWAYNALKKNWTFSFGSESLNVAADFPSAVGGAGTPTSRYWAASWTDSSNQLWLFGGLSGADSSILNDLWTYKKAPLGSSTSTKASTSSNNAASSSSSTNSAASSSTNSAASSSTAAVASSAKASTSSSVAASTAASSTAAVASSAKAATSSSSVAASTVAASTTTAAEASSVAASSSSTASASDAHASSSSTAKVATSSSSAKVSSSTSAATKASSSIVSSSVATKASSSTDSKASSSKVTSSTSSTTGVDSQVCLSACGAASCCLTPNPSCYSDSSYSCIPLGNSNILCGKTSHNGVQYDAGVCGGGCYDTHCYNCNGNELTPSGNC